MKKIQMIKEIEKILIKQFKDYSYDDPKELRKAAKILLQDLEKSGMQPPRYYVPCTAASDGWYIVTGWE